MSTALLATLRAVFTDGSTPVRSYLIEQPLALAQYTAGHILVENVNEDGSPHSLAYDVLLLGVRRHPTDSTPAISLQASNLAEDPDGNPADNWAKFELIPGHWLNVPPKIYGYDVVSLIGGDTLDRLPVVPHSQWTVTAENVHPGDDIQVPEFMQPLARGPESELRFRHTVTSADVISLQSVDGFALSFVTEGIDDAEDDLYGLSYDLLVGNGYPSFRGTARTVSGFFLNVSGDLVAGDIIEIGRKPGASDPSRGPRGLQGLPGAGALPGLVGDIQPVGTSAVAGTSGKYADAAHVHEDLSVGGVTGSYTNASITVDSHGRITSASSGTGGSNPEMLPFFDGLFNPSLWLGAVTDGTWLLIIPDDPFQNSAFRGSFRSTANGGGYPNDDVIDLGFPGVIGTVGGASFAIESGYWTGSTFQQEIHIRTKAPADGMETRLLSGEQHSNGTTGLFLAATSFIAGSGHNAGDISSNINIGTTAARITAGLSYVNIQDDQIVINLGNSSHPPNSIQIYDSAMAIAVRNGNLGNNAPPQLSWDGAGAYAGGAFYAVAGVGMYGAMPGNQYSTTGTVTGFTAGSGTGVNDVSTFTGNTGTTAYTISDLVRAMKYYGQLAL